MIEFENVTVREQGKTILQNVSFSVTKNEKAILYGKSGSGKTTILRTLLGGHVPVDGYIKFDGYTVDKTTIAMVRTSIAYIGQEPFLGDGTVEDALLLPFDFKANSMHRPSRSTLIDTLELVGLTDAILKSTTDTISGGEKQRIAVARSLLLNKSVFCIDEVTSALDLDSAEKIVSLFRNKPATILSVSHDSRWFSIADRFIEIDNGTVNSNTTDRSKVQI